VQFRDRGVFAKPWEGMLSASNQSSGQCYQPSNTFHISLPGAITVLSLSAASLIFPASIQRARPGGN
jgi:hypothetical protein